MPGFYNVQLPAFRPASPLDFSGLNEGLDSLAKTIKENRLFDQARAVGEALRNGSSSNADGSTTPHPQVNSLLDNFYQTPESLSPSPAQASAAAAGRDYPVNALGASGNVDPNALVKSFEGFTPTAKPDYKQTSIGYGTKAAPGETTITRAEADRRLQAETGKVASFLDANAPGLDPTRRAALISFGYNLGTGPGGLSDLLPDVKAGNWDRVAATMQRYNHAGGEVNSGLTTRRAQEAQLIRTGGGAGGGNLAPVPSQTVPPSVAPTGVQGSGGPGSAGLNYAAGVNVALKNGDIATATKLMQLQQEQASQGQTSQLTGLKIQEAQQSLHDQATAKLAAAAQVVQNEPDPARQAQMWQRLVGVHPEMAATLQKYGVDPSDAKAGTQLLIAEAQGLTPPKAPSLTKIGVDKYGHDIMGIFDPRTNTARPIQIEGQQQGQMAGASSNARGEDALGQYPALIADKARNILAGREKLPVATRGDPTALATAEAVRNADPSYNSNRFHYREQWENPNGSVGKTRIANNTAIGHMGELDQLVDKLPDSYHGPGAQTINAVRNWWAGNHTDPVLSQWAANSKLLADEIVKVATGSGAGAVGDREEVLSTLNPANGREALKATLQKYVHIMASKTEALAHDRDRVMGPAAEGMDVIDEVNKPVIERLLKRYGADGPQSDQPQIKLAPRPQGATDEQIIANAQKAIQDGKDPAAVKQQLEAWGIKL